MPCARHNLNGLKRICPFPVEPMFPWQAFSRQREIERERARKRECVGLCVAVCVRVWVRVSVHACVHVYVYVCACAQNYVHVFLRGAKITVSPVSVPATLYQ